MFRIDKCSVGYQMNSPYLIAPKAAPSDLEQLRKDEQLLSSMQETSALSNKMNEELHAMEEKCKQAEEAVSSAQKQAEAIISQAQLDAQGIRTQALQDGYRQGEEKALAAMHLQREKETAEVQRLLQDVAEIRTELLENAERDIVNLSIDIAEKIVHIELDRGDNAIFTMVKNALVQMKTSGKITVHVSPEEYKRYFKTGSAEFQLIDEVIHVAVVEDVALSKGGYLLESDDETISAGIDRQFDVIKDALKGTGVRPEEIAE